MNDFVALDVETANCDQSSICQIGIVTFKDSNIVNKWETLINPEDYFDGFNSSIHGIYEEDVENSPTLPEVYENITALLNKKICVSHGSFDKTAIERAFQKYNLTRPNTIWLNNFMVVRRTWEQFSERGYGLKNVANHLGIKFEHHNALEDAKAAGLIFIEAVNKTGLCIDDWTKRVKRPIIDTKNSLTPNPEGVLFGEVMVFSGDFEVVKAKLQEIAANSGATIGKSVTKKTTILVTGMIDKNKLSKGAKKYSKMLKAESLMSAGQDIRIITEDDFHELINEN